MNRRNLLLSTDSYKASHWLQYPPGMKAMTSYIEARAPGHSVFFGLQAIIKEYLLDPITEADIIEAAEVFAAHGEPFNIDGWLHILRAHGGYIPVQIRAVPEGTVVPNGNVLVTVSSTDPQVPWVASYIETLLLRVWYPTTVATKSYEAKKVIRKSLQETADNLDGLAFKLHDFGARGVSSGESAMMGGMAHLTNFLGTDTVEALVGARRYYDCQMAGFSIPAAEHSTITSWGRYREKDAYLNMIRAYSKPGSIYAVVSDSYDLKNAVSNLFGQDLRQEVIDGGGTLVIRPDSGDPVENVVDTCERLRVAFGSTMNSKGFHVLNNVRVIQGDGINGPMIASILYALKQAGFSADNVAFGMGGGLLQQCDRDTLGFAMKCSAIFIDGTWQDVFKDAPGKKSKRGLLDLVLDRGSFRTINLRDGSPWEDHAISMLRIVYHNGQMKNALTMGQVRENTCLW